MLKISGKDLQFLSSIILAELVLIAPSLILSNKAYTAEIEIAEISATLFSNHRSFPKNHPTPQELNTFAQLTSATQLKDVKSSDSYFQALESLIERYGINMGYPDGTFKGEQTLTRYEFANYLNQALNNAKVNPNNNAGDQPKSVSQLLDVQPTDWAFEALRSLVERYGMDLAYPDGTFKGNRAITRGEFATYINQALGYSEVPQDRQALTRGEFAIFLNQALETR